MDRQTDWDGAPGEALTAASFLVNDGRTEAVQFDGALNSGLLVAANIDSLVTGVAATSRLPLGGIAVEVWFEVCPTPRTLHPAPYTLHSAPYTLHLTPCTLHPAPCTLHPAPYTLHPTPCTLHPTPYTQHLKPYTVHP